LRLLLPSKNAPNEPFFPACLSGWQPNLRSLFPSRTSFLAPLLRQACFLFPPYEVLSLRLLFGSCFTGCAEENGNADFAAIGEKCGQE
jgi:hypothetical protein